MGLLQGLFQRTVDNSLKHFMICSPEASESRAQQSSSQRKSALPAPLQGRVLARLRINQGQHLLTNFFQLYIPVEFTVPPHAHLTPSSIKYHHSHLVLIQKWSPMNAGQESCSPYLLSPYSLCLTSHLPAGDTRHRELTTASCSAHLLLTLQVLLFDHSPVSRALSKSRWPSETTLWVNIGSGKCRLALHQCVRPSSCPPVSRAASWHVAHPADTGLYAGGWPTEDRQRTPTAGRGWSSARITTTSHLMRMK